MDVIEELKFWENSQKIGGGGVGRGQGGGVGLVGGQGGCERRIEVFVKIQKKNGGGGGRGGWVGGCRIEGGQGGCERRIEVFGKIHPKKIWGVGREGRGSGGGSGWWGVRVDVNAILGVGDDVGYGGCEPRIEGIIQ